MSATPLKRLAGQTAVYGLPTIVGRMLNYALVPFFTYIFGKPADFGLNIEFYAYISFLNILFTYGMETGLFNFSVSEPDKNLVYSTALRSLVVSTIVLSIPFLIFAPSLASLLRYPGHGEFILWAILIVGTDALTAIPFAKLREENKAKRFARIKMLNIAVQLLLNLFFVGVCKFYHEKHPGSFLGNLYDPQIGIAYAFVANLAANIISILFLLPEMLRIRYGFDLSLWKRMMTYSLPLLIVGFGGMTNETMDRILLKYMLPANIAESQVGIYGACYKISILMTLFVMAFRYAAEPFFFSRQKDKDAHTMYGKVMTWFVIFCLLIFLGTTLNISWIKYFVGKEYRAGLPVVPILLLANLFLGMYFNLSIWYKLTGRTKFGMWLTLFGAAITLLLNFLWIPSANIYYGGYMGSAWATLICYASMMVLSYFVGQKYYRVDYDVFRVLAYLSFAIGLFFAGKYLPLSSHFADLCVKNLLIIFYIAVVVLIEKPQRFIRRNTSSPDPKS
ncbi:MAG: polysaccharide biosynthesis C-terminal domain-containing protein [Bacteroidetes bacterium]|nr:polysaccharide biosynthesis C-terminal domain-containing protein [Bacteroidota bacterium]